jgi:hypothetical protein
LVGWWFQVNLSKTFTRAHINQWLGVVVCVCYPSYTGNTDKRVMVQVGLGTKQDPTSKITKAKKTNRAVQWQSTCLANARPRVQPPVQPKRKQKEKKELLRCQCIPAADNLGTCCLRSGIKALPEGWDQGSARGLGSRLCPRAGIKALPRAGIKALPEGWDQGSA